MAKLLIVDDQKGIRTLLTEVFEASGHATNACGTGLQALETIPAFQPDLVIMDVKMPGMSGIDVLKRLRELAHPCQVILMTAYGEQHYVDQASDLGVARFITKPFDLNELKKQVEALL